MKNQDNSEKEKFMQKAVKVMVEKDLTEKYKGILLNKHNIHKKEDEPPKKIKNYLVRFAAAFIAIVLIFILLKYNFNNGQELAIQFAQETTVLGNQQIMRKGPNTWDSIRILANSAFVDKKFSEAIKHYDFLLSTEKMEDIDHFYLGVSYLKSEKPDPNLAIKHLQIAQSIELLHPEIDWFMALAKIMNKDYPGAIILLNKIKAYQNYKNKEIQEILRKIEQKS